MRNISTDFILSRQPDQRFDKSIQISADMFISLGYRVPFRELRKSNGDKILLIGRAVEASDSGQAQKIEGQVKDDVFLQSQNWAGRWLLVSAKELVPDGAASLACFYPIAQNGIIAASHPTLASRTATLIDEPAVASGHVIPPG